MSDQNKSRAKKKCIVVYLTEDEYDLLVAEVERSMMHKNGIFRKALKEYLEKGSRRK
jgi:uncharacterized protein YqgQ